MSCDMRVARQRRRRVAHAMILDHARPHHEPQVHAFFALRLIVDLKLALTRFRGLAERNLSARAAPCRTRQMQRAGTCFGQWPLGCRAPLLPRGRIDRAEMDRRLALPAVVHVLEEAIEEA